MQRKKKSYFVKLSACFPDASEAEDFFQKLDQMRDASIYDVLTLLLDELSSTKAQIIKVSLNFSEHQRYYLLVCNFMFNFFTIHKIFSETATNIMNILLYSFLD